ncbi:MAG TPA: GNAT family N-acetyltransferase [Nocardioidaceae bacterium]|nr:GNAT family N-acetyltransferase [Nocardioidaceae bacterium]
MGDVRVASFAELDARVGYDLWALRSAVFVVEQECAYLDLDGRDTEPGTRHVWIEDGGAPVAYLRILDEGGHQRIGRVVAASHRGRGLADRLMDAAVGLVGDGPSRLEAQSHLERWYERFGYARCGEDYVEDGIPHTPMVRPGGAGLP